MKKLIISIILFLSSVSLFAQTEWEINPYFMPINYSDSYYREKTNLFGLYGSLGIGLNHTIEAEVDYLDLRLVDDVKLKQFDYTFTYTNLSVPEWIFRLGTHFISSEDQYTDKSYVIFGGIGKYRFRKWDLMVNTYFSNYNNYRPSLKVLQISPEIGFNFLIDRSQGFYLKTLVNYITINNKLYFGSKNFFSIKETLTYFIDNFSVSAYALIGRQAFGVRENGFIIYNAAEEYKNGYGGSIKYSFGNSVSLKVGIEKDTFSDFSLDNKAVSTKLIFLAGFKF